MNNPVQPPLQSQIPNESGSPEGREYGNPGRIYADGVSGSIWRKTTQIDVNTGWVLVSGGSSATNGIYTPATFAEARTIALTPTPVMAAVQGADASGDGGQGIYIWIASSTTPDDGFNSIALTANGADPGRFIRFFN